MLSTLNTVSIFFDSKDKYVPSPAEYGVFLKETMEMKTEDILSIGNTVKNRLRIKFTSEKLVEECFKKIEELKLYSDSQGREYNLSIYNESSKQIVKIHGVPFEMSEDEIKKSLEMYGVVDGFRKEKWNNIGFNVYNEIITVRMEIKNPIPSYLRIMGRQYWVTYFGQVKTCRRCNATSHEAKDCDYNAKNIVNRHVNYAAATKSPNLFAPEYMGKVFPDLPENRKGIKTKEKSIDRENVAEVEKEPNVREVEKNRKEKSRQTHTSGKEVNNKQENRESGKGTKDIRQSSKENQCEEGSQSLCSQHSLHPNQQQNNECKAKRRAASNISDTSSDEQRKRSNKLPHLDLNYKFWAEEMDAASDDNTTSSEGGTIEPESPISTYKTTPPGTEDEAQV